MTLNQLVDKVQHANRSLLVGALRAEDSNLPVVAGQTLQGVPDIGLLLITTRDGRPVYVRDVADVVVGGRARRAPRLAPRRRPRDGTFERLPAVSTRARQAQGRQCRRSSPTAILERLAAGARPHHARRSVAVTVTRDYGATANEKVNELLFHLALATLSIVVLITLADRLARRRGRLRRHPDDDPADAVRLLADGLHDQPRQPVRADLLDRHPGRRRHRRGREHRPPLGDAATGATALQAAIDAVAEVGNPTIVATLTVIAALLPMMFVSGLMGPYMSPIPANASAAMLFSFFVAVVVTPWLMLQAAAARRRPAAGHGEAGGRRRARAASIAASPCRCSPGRRRSWIFLLVRRRGDDRGLRRSSTPRTWRSSCCPSTTSPRSRSWSTCRAAAASRTTERVLDGGRRPAGRTCRS